MTIPAFEDFLDSLEEETFAAEIEQASPFRVIQGENLTEAQGKLAAAVYRLAVEDSVRLSLLYLRKYHEWIREQLS